MKNLGLTLFDSPEFFLQVLLLSNEIIHKILANIPNKSYLKLLIIFKNML